MSGHRSSRDDCSDPLTALHEAVIPARLNDVRTTGVQMRCIFHNKLALLLPQIINSYRRHLRENILVPKPHTHARHNGSEDANHCIPAVVTAPWADIVTMLRLDRQLVHTTQLCHSVKAGNELAARLICAHIPGRKLITSSSLHHIFKTHSHHETISADGFAAQRKPEKSLLLIYLAKALLQASRHFLTWYLCQDRRQEMSVQRSGAQKLTCKLSATA